MPIPASGFCLSTVCAEFIGNRLGGGSGGNNLPSLDNMVYWGSQQCSTMGIGLTTCRLSNFANKCRGSIIGTPSAIATPKNGVLEYCVEISNEFGAGNDFRPINSTVTDASIEVCWINDPSSYEGGNDIISAGTTTTTTTLTGHIILYNPDPQNGNVTTTVFANPRVFNGFGLLQSCGGCLYNVASIPWLAQGG
jgi:hypothetical protein